MIRVHEREFCRAHRQFRDACMQEKKRAKLRKNKNKNRINGGGGG